MIEMNKKCNVLFIAYYFPPDSSSGALRPLFFANHLLEMGAKVTVLTARREDFLGEQPKDHSLVSRLHKDVRVVRAKVRRPREYVLSLRDKWFSDKTAKPNEKSRPGSSPGSGKINKSARQKLKDLITDLLASPDPHVGWIPDAVKCGRRIIEENEIDVVIATGSPWSGLLTGVLLRKKRGIPLILDFRDPWVANPGFTQRGRFSGYLETKMEHYVVSRADKIIANTEELRRNFLQRYPFLSADNVYSLPNGFEDYLVSKAPRNKHFTLVHAGALYFSRTPLPLLEALYELLSTGEIASGDIRLVLVGGIDAVDEKLQKLLDEPLLNEAVQVIPRLPYAEALAHQLEADALLLVQPGFPLQVPRKLYEYMAMRRAVLALTDESGATARVIRECNLGSVVQNNAQAIKPVLLEMFRRWQENSVGCQASPLVENYKNDVLTRRLFEILQESKRLEN